MDTQKLRRVDTSSSLRVSMAADNVSSALSERAGGHCKKTSLQELQLMAPPERWGQIGAFLRAPGWSVIWQWRARRWTTRASQGSASDALWSVEKRRRTMNFLKNSSMTQRGSRQRALLSRLLRGRARSLRPHLAWV